MANFYRPFIVKLRKTETIIYVAIGVEELIEESQEAILEYLVEVYDKHKLYKGDYHIDFVWTDGKEIMCDVWMFLELENDEAGYTVDCKNFRELKEIRKEGVTASDGLIILGRECELEESMRKAGRPLIEYIEGHRPSETLAIVSAEEWGEE